MTRVGFIQSILCASKGIFSSISNERNIKIQMLFGVVLVLFALILEVSKTYLITIIIVCFLIIILEMFNRGFEKLIDLISPEYNKEFGRVKDIMAGVVLLTFIMAAVVSFLILYSPLIKLLKFLSQNYLFLLSLIATILLILIYLLTYLIKEKRLKNDLSL